MAHGVDIHDVHLKHITPDGKISRHMAGRFAVLGGKVTHLEDYHGILENVIPEGSDASFADRVIQKLKHHPYLDVQSEGDALEGRHLDKLPEAEIPEPPKAEELGVRPPAVFHYHRVGHDKPHTLEVAGDKASIDGRELTPPEIKTIKYNIDSGVAHLRYKQGASKMGTTLAKAQGNDEEEPDYNWLDTQIPSHLNLMEEQEKQGVWPKGTARNFRRNLYEDKMTPGLGNKAAFTDFNSKPRPGVFVSMDGNGFREINNTYGHPTGDEAIRTFGKHAREAADETMGDQAKKGKLFRDVNNIHRTGGDEFVAHFPTSEHAATFARLFRSKLEGVPAIGGTHKLSMSFGLGPDHSSSDAALYMAKKAKDAHLLANNLHAGQAPNFAHSLVPGQEGPIPLDNPHPLKAPGMVDPPVEAPSMGSVPGAESQGSDLPVPKTASGGS